MDVQIENLSIAHSAQSLLRQLPFYCPSFNSVRKLADSSKLQESLQTAFQPDRVHLGFLSTDANLYLAFSHLLALSRSSEEPKEESFKVPTNVREGLQLQSLLEHCDDLGKWLGDQSAQKYFRHVLLTHELEQLWKQPSATELERVF